MSRWSKLALGKIGVSLSQINHVPNIHANQLSYSSEESEGPYFQLNWKSWLCGRTYTRKDLLSWKVNLETTWESRAASALVSAQSYQVVVHMLNYWAEEVTVFKTVTGWSRSSCTSCWKHWAEGTHPRGQEVVLWKMVKRYGSELDHNRKKYFCKSARKYFPIQILIWKWLAIITTRYTIGKQTQSSSQSDDCFQLADMKFSCSNRRYKTKISFRNRRAAGNNGYTGQKRQYDTFLHWLSKHNNIISRCIWLLVLWINCREPNGSLLLILSVCNGNGSGREE